MGVAGNETHGHVLIGRQFDLPRTKNPDRVTIDEQAQHHPRRILFGAGAPCVGLHLTQVHAFDGFDDKVRQMVVRNPVAQIRRQQHWG